MCKYSIILLKTGKIHDIPGLSSEFSGWNCIQVLVKLENYHLRSAVRNYHSALHRYGQIFFKRGISFYKSKYFQKTEIFSGQKFSALTILFDGIPKFWGWIPHPALKFKPCKRIFIKDINDIDHCIHEVMIFTFLLLKTAKKLNC